MRIKIDDDFGIHSGFFLNLKPGYTPLVGPNGAGKTTLLRQLREYANGHGIMVFDYSNLVHGGGSAMDKYLWSGNMELLAISATSSEGERIAMNFGQAVSRLGAAVREAKQQKKELFILLDALDSGSSIDRIREIRSLFDLVAKDAGDTAYIICACNAYELVKDAEAVNVRTGKTVRFKDYGEYADFVCSFMEKFAPPKREEETKKGGRMRKRG